MTLLSQLAALAAVAGTGVVYGTDVFCALVLRPAVLHLSSSTAFSHLSASDDLQRS